MSDFTSPSFPPVFPKCVHASIASANNPLVERVGAGAPPDEEHGQTDGLEHAGKGADGDGVERALLGEDLGDELRWDVSMDLVGMR